MRALKWFLIVVVLVASGAGLVVSFTNYNLFSSCQSAPEYKTVITRTGDVETVLVRDEAEDCPFRDWIGDSVVRFFLIFLLGGALVVGAIEMVRNAATAGFDALEKRESSNDN
jgi:hypothetical protein